MNSRLTFRQRLLTAPPTLALMFILCLFLAHGVWGLYEKNQLAAENADEAAQGLSEVQVREASLAAQLAHIKTSSGVEEELRQKFDVAREGEHLIVIVDAPAATSTGETNETLWGRIWAHLRI